MAGSGCVSEGTMTSPIDESAVRHIARLARLELSDAEVHQYTAQLAEILAYVQQLSAVDVSGAEPTSHAAPQASALRNDTPGPTLTPDQALANAPQREGSFFGLPKVLDQEDA